MNKIHSDIYIEYIQMIGRITLADGNADISLNYLIELYLGDGKGQFVWQKLRRLDDRIKLLKELVSKFEEDDVVKDQICHLMQVFKQCSESRNTLIHSGYVTEKEHRILQLEKASNKPGYPTTSTRISLKRLSELVDVYEKLAGRLNHLTMYVAQEMGYQVLSGTLQIGLPQDPLAFPPTLEPVDPNDVGFREWRRRGE